MKLNAPKKANWIIAVVLAVLALVAYFTGLGGGAVAFWLAFASAALLIVTTFLAGA